MFCSYVIIRTRPRSFLSQLHVMEAFITTSDVHGKLGYFLVTANMAVDYVGNLSLEEVRAAWCVFCE